MKPSDSIRLTRTLLGSAAALAVPIVGGATHPEVPREPLVCATPQFTDVDRQRGKGASPMSLLSKGDSLKYSPLINQHQALDYYAYQLFLAADAWSKADSLANAQGRILLAVHFLDGTPRERELVKMYASAWEGATASRVGFVFDSNETRHIRISFARPLNQSAIGNQAKTISDVRRPTMFLGELRARTDESRIRHVIQHEFGHSLGLRHEHQHPVSGISWDEPAIYTDLRPYGWSREDVRRDITQTYVMSFACKGNQGFDQTSVMIYPIPQAWTVGDFTVSGGQAISVGDTRCVQSIYRGG